MNLEEKRCKATEIYAKHGLVVDGWQVDMACTVKPIHPCSEFAIYDAMDAANVEIAEALGETPEAPA